MLSNCKHGYGSHTCEKAMSKGLPSYRCIDNFEGRHTVTVLNKKCNRKDGGIFYRDIEVLNLGKRFPLTEFTLVYDCKKEVATYTSTVSGTAGTRYITFFNITFFYVMFDIDQYQSKTIHFILVCIRFD